MEAAILLIRFFSGQKIIAHSGKKLLNQTTELGKQLYIPYIVSVLAIAYICASNLKR